MKFEFTGTARRALELAKEEASRFMHSRIGTEHILLGLLRVQEGVAYTILTSSGVTLSQVRKLVEQYVPPGIMPVASNNLPMNENALRALNLAQEEARRLSKGFIGTEHLLLRSKDSSIFRCRLRPGPRRSDWYTPGCGETSDKIKDKKP